MKVCPQCASQFSDRIDFCFHDGSVLDAQASAAEPDAVDLPPLILGGRFSGAGGLDLPDRPRPSDLREGDLTPVPLKPMRLPPPERVVKSPLSELPPPPMAGDTLIPLEDTDEVLSTTTPPPAAARAAAERTRSESSGQARDEGVPGWVWIVGFGIAGVAVAAGAIFALGGVGLLSAIGLTGGDEPELVAVAAPPDDDRFPEPPESDEDRFPVPPVEIGVQNPTASDGDAVASGPDDSGVNEIEDPGAAVDAAPEPATTVAAATGGGSERPEPRELGTSDALPTSGSGSSGGTSPSTSGPSGSASAGDAADTPSPWGPVDPPEPPPSNAPAAAELVDVLVLMEGTGEGITLFIDGVKARGSFPHSVRLTPGMHRFKVQASSGQSYEIGKTVGKSDERATQVQLIPPG